MRKPFIAGNWKMFKTIDEAIKLAAEIKRELLDCKEVDIVLCPPFTSLYSVHEIIMETDIQLGAQDTFWEREGAYTGEISPAMLKDCGADFTIIGHSERRQYFLETDETVNKKIKAALHIDLRPIVCIGETLGEREEAKTTMVVQTQLEGSLKGLNEQELSKIIIAYEPVWAIGTGKTATSEQAEEVQKFIRRWIETHYSHPVASQMRILYGGSVKPSNVKDLMQQENIDGALVGGASLDASSFIEIVKDSI